MNYWCQQILIQLFCHSYVQYLIMAMVTIVTRHIYSILFCTLQSISIHLYGRCSRTTWIALVNFLHWETQFGWHMGSILTALRKSWHSIDSGNKSIKWLLWLKESNWGNSISIDGWQVVYCHQYHQNHEHDFLKFFQNFRSL